METVREGLQGGITSPEKAAASIKGKDMHRGKRLMDAHSWSQEDLYLQS